MSPKLLVEFPNFGFGPVMVALTLLDRLRGEYDCEIVSTGEAARFVADDVGATLAIHDLDTFDRGTWPELLRLTSPGDVLLSITNPELAVWMAERGRRVGVVDTLSWMWGSPKGFERLAFCLEPAFFGAAETPQGRERVAPIVDDSLWQRQSPAASIRRGRALIGFGGMAVPGQAETVEEYVRWSLAASLPIILDELGCDSVAIIGGRDDLESLIPARWREDRRLEVIVGLNRRRYHDQLTEAEFLFLTPGLNTIHECEAVGLAPVFQPGFNMSMVLQARALAAVGYGRVAELPIPTAEVEALSKLSEVDGLRVLASWQEQIVRRSDPQGVILGEVIRTAFAASSALVLPTGRALPDCHESVLKHLAPLF